MTADPATLAAAPGRRGTRRRLAILAGCAFTALAGDAVSKHLVVARLGDGHVQTLIPNVLDLELTRNAGAAFSLGTGSTAVFTLVAVGVVVLIIRLAPRLASTAWAVVLGLLLGGALGNLADRVFRAPGVGRGAVVDWIHLHHWPIFNIADSAITVGAVLAVILSMRGIAATSPRERADGSQAQ